jgi:hypothetical protein
MSLIFRDRVRQKANPSGTGSVTLGASVATYKQFVNADLNNDSFPYAIVNTSQFEVGIGNYITPLASGTTYGVLNRNLVLSNSNNDTSFIAFNGSSADVIITNAAELSVLVSSQPAPATFKLIKWTGAQYELIDPIENFTSLGTSIDSSVMFFNATNTNFQADPKFQYYQGNVPELYLDGVFQATAKAFKIPHPTKPKVHLQHGCLEGPEYGIYLRGTASINYKTSIILPDYFTALTQSDSYTVSVSSNSFIPVKHKKEKNKVVFSLLFPTIKPIEIDFLIIDKRTDIDFKLEV